MRSNEHDSRATNWETYVCFTKTYLSCYITGRTTSDYKRRHLHGVKEFRDYFRKLFTRNSELSFAQFDAYLADFSRLEATVAAEFSELQRKVRQALKTVGTNKTLTINGLSYELYLRMSHVFLPLLVIVNNNWMK